MKEMNLDFTGEYFIPGRTNIRIEEDHMARYRFAAKFVKDKRVLDIACGVGYAAKILIDGGLEFYKGVDINENLINYANQNFLTEKSVFEIGDILKFQESNKYDIITCFETIEHIKDYKKVIANLFELLKPGGSLLISSPNRIVTSPRAKNISDRPVNKFHTQEFTPKELTSELISSGFKVSSTEIFGQRLRPKLYQNRFIGKIGRFLFGDPDVLESPEVSYINSKLPRYFLIVARKLKG